MNAADRLYGITMQEKRGINAGISRPGREPAYPVAEGMKQYGRRKKRIF